MDIALSSPVERALRALADRVGVSVERYVAETLTAHAGSYDDWFEREVEKGLADLDAGRRLSPEASALRDQNRRARLAQRLR